MSTNEQKSSKRNMGTVIESTINNPKEMPKPAKIMTQGTAVKGMLHEYKMIKDGQFGDTYKLLIRDKANQDWICYIAITGGDQYDQLYMLVQENTVPFPIDISVSDGQKGRTLKLLTGKSKTKLTT